MKSLSVALLASVFAFAPLGAQAASSSDYITGYVGQFDFSQRDNQSTVFGAEYRFSPYDLGLRPIVGFNIGTDGNMYGYAGINWDVALISNQLYIIPNFAAGVYSEGSDGKDLGGAIEFRSGIELAYQLPNTHRVGIAFNHISNASIYDRNPGAETLLVNYSVPVGAMFNW